MTLAEVFFGVKGQDLYNLLFSDLVKNNVCVYYIIIFCTYYIISSVCYGEREQMWQNVNNLKNPGER